MNKVSEAVLQNKARCHDVLNVLTTFTKFVGKETDKLLDQKLNHEKKEELHESLDNINLRLSQLTQIVSVACATQSECMNQDTKQNITKTLNDLVPEFEKIKLAVPEFQYTNLPPNHLFDMMLLQQSITEASRDTLIRVIAHLADEDNETLEKLKNILNRIKEKELKAKVPISKHKRGKSQEIKGIFNQIDRKSVSVGSTVSPIISFHSQIENSDLPFWDIPVNHSVSYEQLMDTIASTLQMDVKNLQLVAVDIPTGQETVVTARDKIFDIHFGWKKKKELDQHKFVIRKI